MTPELKAILQKHCPELLGVVVAAKAFVGCHDAHIDAIAVNAGVIKLQRLESAEETAEQELVRAVKRMQSVSA